MPTTPVNRTVQDIYPLSPTQQGLLFHSLYGNSEAGAYIVQVAYTLKGKLNHTAFEQAWQQVTNRHTILRTAFVWDNLESPVQVVGQQVELPLHWHDWQALSFDEQTEKLSGFIAADRAQGFNLSHAPLMRINAFQLSRDRYRIVWSHHHILLDGWSLPLLLREWIACYQGACGQTIDRPADRPASLQNPANLGEAYPYRDYIAWLQQQDLAAAKQFWKARLAGISAPTPLGIDSTGADNTERNTQQSFKAQHYKLSAQLAEQLKEFAQQHRLTLSSLVQGAWAKVLSVYSGESSVLYGLACAGRPESLPAANRRVGLFINTLPMRVDMAADSQLIPWLQNIQAQQLAQQPYEYTPLTEIQAASDIPRQSQLFDSVVVFENYPLESTQGIAGLDLLDVSIAEQTHYPLALFAVATKTLAFKVLYDAQRFSQRAIARLFNHLHTTLEAIAASPQSNLDAISILSTAEQQQLLDDGKGPTVPVSSRCVHELIAQQANQNPNATAVVFEGAPISYGQLNARANQLAHYLKQQQISVNAPVGLYVERSVEMIVALLAILKAGCAYVPLDPSYPASRLQYAVEDAGIEWIICHEATARGLQLAKQQIQLLNLDGAADEIAAQPTTEPSSAVSPKDFAYLIYTSGSTGKPKGVPIAHESLSNLLNAIAIRLKVKPTDTLMAVTTIAFDIAALELFLPLISGACLLLASNDTARNAHQLIAYLDAYGVDVMQATPATWRMLFNSGWAGQNGLRILCGGEALDVELARQLLNCGEEVWNMYGPTETTIWSGALALSEETLTGGSVPIGAPIDNTRFYVLDERRQAVPVGVAGELYIGGVGLSQGYWKREDLTAERFVDGLYKTGDRARYREDGNLDYLGRLDYQTKLRGYRVELGEIESAISTYKDIDQAVVVLQGNTAENQRLAAYFTLNQRNEKDELVESSRIVRMLRFSARETLSSHLTTQLPHYMVPTTYQLLSAFPLTPNGKIDRQALPAIAAPQVTPDNNPKTTLESALAKIWKSLLSLETISIHDNFFEIGGHSLLVVKAQSQIRQRLGIELPMVDLFRYPTLNTLAVHINSLDKATEQAKEDNVGRDVAVAAGKQRLRQRLTQRKSTEQLGGKAR